MKKDIYKEIKDKLSSSKSILGDVSSFSKEELIEELLIYQTELEAQNDELYQNNQEILALSEENKLLFMEAPIPYMLIEKENIKTMNKKAKSIFFPYNKNIFFLETLCVKDGYEKLHTWMHSEDMFNAIELPLKTVRDGIKWFLLKLELLEPNLLLLSFTDIDEIKKLQNTIVEQDKLLLRKAVFESKGEVLSMLAHQWRQPLASISMYINSMVADFGLGTLNIEEIPQHLYSLEQRISDISKMIDDFQKEFKIDKALEKVDLFELFEKTASIMRTHVNDVSIEIECTECITMKAYHNELLQILINLIDNSIHAFENKEQQDSKIIISAFKNENTVYIEVKDNGIGIDESNIDKIFDPYFSTKNSLNGTGLGLYIVKLLVEEHHKGEVQVVSQQGKGTTFKMIFPCLDE